MGEAGVFVSFEEAHKDLVANVASLGFDIEALEASGKLRVDHVVVNREEIEATGEFDLDGLFVRLEHAIRSIGAKRVALDTVESLFSGLPNPLIVRAELRRLFFWLKARGVTTVITAERGEKGLTRDGLEEYVSDCVILLDQRLLDEIATRRIRIVKYRGSSHGTNEFPFVIDEKGFSVVPITGSHLDRKAPHERLSTGVPGLDALVGGKGYYRGSGILVSGTAGTGKSTMAAHFLDAACARGERAIYFSFEEAPAVLLRDLRAVGIDLARWVEKGALRFTSTRVTTEGLETHVAKMVRAVREFGATIAVIDPISAFDTLVHPREARNMVTLLADAFRVEGVTIMMTYLTTGGHAQEATTMGISSAMDAWITLRDEERDGERHRALCVLKTRGLKNSRRITPYEIGRRGIEIASAPPRGREGRA